MRTSKIDKPGKVYVVTSKTKQGSVGNSSGGKVCWSAVLVCRSNVVNCFRVNSSLSTRE